MKKIILENKLLLLLLTIGTIFQVSIIFPSGLLYEAGLQFWGVHYHDTMWHIAVANRISQLSFDNPIYANEPLKNYHYITDLFMAFIHRSFQIPLLDVVFRVYPVVISLLIGITVYKFSYFLFGDKDSALWSTFFTYFGSSFAYILILFGFGTDYWEGNLWVMQSHSVMANLPLATSFVLIPLAFINLNSYLQKGKQKHFLATSLFLGLLPATKSFSIVILGVLAIISVFYLIFKRDSRLFKISLASTSVALVLFLPILTLRSHFIYEPGYFLRTLMEAPDRLNWEKWTLEMQYYQENVNYIHLSRLWLTSFAIFILGNLGTRIFSLFSLIFFKKQMFTSSIHLILVFSAILFAILPMLVLTTGIAWNSIQFFYYFLFISGIYAGKGVSVFIGRANGHLLKIFLSILIVCATLPVGLKTVHAYLSDNPNLIITHDELEALSFMSEQKDVVVLTLPIGGNYNYVSAITGKSLYLGDKVQSSITGMDYAKREQEVIQALSDQETMREFSIKNNIGWVYLKDKDNDVQASLGQIGKLVFESDRLVLYKIK